MMNWFREFRAFFRKHDWEVSPILQPEDIIFRWATCKKCGSKELYIPNLMMMSPPLAHIFWYGCPGKKSDIKIGE
jgi:hypothetical protein